MRREEQRRLTSLIRCDGAEAGAGEGDASLGAAGQVIGDNGDREACGSRGCFLSQAEAWAHAGPDGYSYSRTDDGLISIEFPGASGAV